MRLLRSFLGDHFFEVQTREYIPRPMSHIVWSFVSSAVMETGTRDCGTWSDLYLFRATLWSGIKGVEAYGFRISSGLHGAIASKGTVDHDGADCIRLKTSVH